MWCLYIYIPDLSDEIFQKKITYYDLFNSLKPKGKKILEEMLNISYEWYLLQVLQSVGSREILLIILTTELLIC